MQFFGDLQIREDTTIGILDLEKLELSVGHGENAFTMSRGSFNYKQKLHWKQKCELIDHLETYNEAIYVFKESRYKTVHRLVASKTEDGVELKYMPEDSNKEPVNRYWLTFKTNASEHIYGCGETYSKFDLKGENVRVWVAEHQNAKRIATKLIKEKIRGKRPAKTLPFSKYESYYAQPTFVSSDKYFVHCFINEYAEFDFSKKDSITLYTQEPISLVAKKADSFEELSFKLSNLLGTQGRPPKWVNEGGIIAMQDWTFDGKNTHEGFDGCGNIDRKLEALKAADAKVVGVWCQDWCGCRCTGFGYQVMWNWEYNNSQYPDLPKKIKEWKEEGVRFLGYINPFLALEKDLYKEAAKNGYCVKDKEGKDYLVTITTFPAAMIDFTNPDAYEWYKDIIKKNMIGIGMGGWMADFGEYLPVDSVLFDGDPKELHNQWPAIWAKLNKEAIKECGMEDEIFFFTRAGHTGTIGASAMMWTGDQHVDWSVDDGLPSVIPATLSLAMSGCGITHSDVGGYTTVMHMKRSRELLLRWEEMNVFSPLFRTHEGNQPSNDVQYDIDGEALEHLAACTRLHGGLKSYIDVLIDAVVEKGTPAMRPLFYHYNEEEAFLEKTEYLLGKDILVAPILVEGATKREVYLPKDSWVHLFTGEEFEGGKYLIDAPMGRIPVFVRKDSDIAKKRLELINNYM